MVQTERVAALARDRYPSLGVETLVIRTEGDADKSTPLTVLGGRGVFTSALEASLLSGHVDAAVHSAKDLPSRLADGCALVAFPERESPEDVLVSRHGVGLAALPPNPVIGTSSRRRAVQVLSVRSDARIVDLRGNLDTRLRRAVEDGGLDGVVLAAAGIERMGWGDQIVERLPLDRFVPSPAQGALAVEARAHDETVGDLLAPLDDPRVSRAVRVERAFLRAIGAGCTTPVGALVTLEGDAERLRLRAMLAGDDGAAMEWTDERLDSLNPEEHAASVAVRMLERVRRDPRVQTVPPAVWAGQAPDLAGCQVLVTRPADQAGPLVAALREAGADARLCPTIEIADPTDLTSLDAAVSALSAGEFDWLAVTSANGARRLAQRVRALGRNTAGMASKAKVAAVGEATARALTAEGIHVDLVPERSHAEGLVEALAERGISGNRVLYVHGDLARRTVVDGLRALGATVTLAEAYRTIPVTEIPAEPHAALLRGEIDVLTFASPSSIAGLTGALGTAADVLRGAVVVCVGAVTAEAATQAGLNVVAVAERPSPEAMVEAVRRAWAARQGVRETQRVVPAGAVSNEAGGQG